MPRCLRTGAMFVFKNKLRINDLDCKELEHQQHPMLDRRELGIYQKRVLFDDNPPASVVAPIVKSADALFGTNGMVDGNCET